MRWLPRPRSWVWATEVNRFTVVYDACVLYPAPLRDLLMGPAWPCGSTEAAPRQPQEPTQDKRGVSGHPAGTRSEQVFAGRAAVRRYALSQYSLARPLLRRGEGVSYHVIPAPAAGGRQMGLTAEADSRGYHLAVAPAEVFPINRRHQQVAASFQLTALILRTSQSLDRSLHH
jgi:hypothetical protein